MNNTKKLVLAGLFIALSVVGGALIIIPVGLAKAAPVQHFIRNKRSRRCGCDCEIRR